MTWGNLIAASAWFIGMVYSALCIALPKIRPNWRGSTTTLGPISCLGMVIFFWGGPLAFLASKNSLISPLLAYLILCCVLVVVFTIGYLMDISE